jgi:hypothetical protein
MATFADAGRAMEQNLEALKRPGVLAVRRPAFGAPLLPGSRA